LVLIFLQLYVLYYIQSHVINILLLLYSRTNTLVSHVTTEFKRMYNCAVLGYCVSCGSRLPTFPETSVNDYHTTPLNVSEERRSHQHRGGSLKSWHFGSKNFIRWTGYFLYLEFKKKLELTWSWSILAETCSHSSFHSFCSLSYDSSVALPKRVLHRVRSSASSFNFQYLLCSIRSSSSCLRLLPRLPVISILPSNFPSITHSSYQLINRTWYSIY
jgi:hypothetical protein